MTGSSFSFYNADVLTPAGVARAPLHIEKGVVASAPQSVAFDLDGFLVLPGIIDLHGDGFERHLAPRRGAVKNLQTGFSAVQSELAAHGITTACLAQFYSWEGGMRGPEFAEKFLQALQCFQQSSPLTLRAQLRFETHMLDHYERFADLCTRFQVPYIVFNDHIPHGALAAGKRPPRLTGQALKSGRNPEAHLALLKQMHDAHDQVPAALLRLRALLRAQTILGSHDDRSAQQRQIWAQMGVSICEFPETYEVAKQAHTLGSPVIMGAPNLLRGGSHKGNIGVSTLLAEGLCDALASDYHYPSLCQAALSLEADIGIAKAWALVSSRPAQILGLNDRGHLAIGQRADMVVLEGRSRAVEGTFAQGRAVHLTGSLAARMTGLVCDNALA